MGQTVMIDPRAFVPAIRSLIGKRRGAPLACSLLGQRGCLEFMDANFLGADQIAELEVNRTFPGTVWSRS